MIKEDYLNVTVDSSDLNLQKERKNSITQKTDKNKKMQGEEFFRKSRHYFIMTEGGTPIYSRYGDEIDNCGILATFSAIITKFTHFGEPNELIQ